MKPRKKPPEPSKNTSSERRNGKAPKKNPGTNLGNGKTVNGYLPEKFAAREARRAPLNLSSPYPGKGRSRRKA